MTTFDKTIPAPADSYAIEKGHPIPGRAGPNRKYPIDRMEVGDSFFVPKLRPTAIHDQAIKMGRLVTVRREGLGYRVWRIA